MRPLVDDVFDAYVTNVEQSGVTCHFGPLYIFISYMSLGEFQEYVLAERMSAPRFVCFGGTFAQNLVTMADYSNLICGLRMVQI